jgi:hypothetical protein
MVLFLDRNKLDKSLESNCMRIVVILTLINSIVQLVWFSLVLYSQKKPSAAFPSCNINMEIYCVGKKILDL